MGRHPGPERVDVRQTSLTSTSRLAHRPTFQGGARKVGGSGAPRRPHLVVAVLLSKHRQGPAIDLGCSISEPAKPRVDLSVAGPICPGFQVVIHLSAAAVIHVACASTHERLHSAARFAALLHSAWWSDSPGAHPLGCPTAKD